jgi:hypothetical protein
MYGAPSRYPVRYLVRAGDHWRRMLFTLDSPVCESRLEGGGVNRAKLKFTKLITTTSRVSVRNIIESAREGEKQIASK